MKKVLIANRGEIAVRIIRTLKEMSIKSVAIYSVADKESLHVALADESFCVGPSQSIKSYLDMDSIITIALERKVDAIHPGYGFLSENSEFARKCEDNEIAFIGPSAKIISEMGDKSKAREIMQSIGIPIIPGSKSVINDVKSLEYVTKEIGFPVVIKAASGGGGKGMRVVHKEEMLIDLYKECMREAEASFGDSRMYVEKYIPRARHIEIQIIGDGKGKVIHLYDRDCSIQRNNQKMIEEAPASILNQQERDAICNLTSQAISKLNYRGVGTVEYLYVEDTREFFFMEMNTRLQVEHTISEEVTGVDIVKVQIAVANNQELSLNQEDISLDGYSIQCRINAEDPKNSFKPTPGIVNKLHFGLGRNSRIDTHVYSGYEMPVYYDSLLAKIIVKGHSRKNAINRMKVVLEETVMEPIVTNLDFQYQLLNNDNYFKNNISISFLEENNLI